MISRFDRSADAMHPAELCSSGATHQWAFIWLSDSWADRLTARLHRPRRHKQTKVRFKKSKLRRASSHLEPRCLSLPALS